MNLQQMIKQSSRKSSTVFVVHLSFLVFLFLWMMPSNMLCSSIEMQGWVTLQLTRDPGYGRGFFSPRSVTGFLSDVCSAAADEVGKIYVTADENVSFPPSTLDCLASVSAILRWCLLLLPQHAYLHHYVHWI